MKTSELTGPALNWAVGVAEGMQWCSDPEIGLYHSDHLRKRRRHVVVALDYCLMDDWELTLYEPSTDWSQGGPIIEREQIATSRGGSYEEHFWMASRGFADQRIYGPTPLIAAMRCYVASKLGDEVEIPPELL